MVDEHIKMLQEVHQGTYQRPNKMSSPKPSRLLTPEPILSQKEVKNLEKALKILQSPINSTLFIHMT